MAIPLNRLRAAALLKRDARVGTLHEARAKGQKAAFLCHSHQDKELVEGLDQILTSAGWNIYIDWRDADMPSRPNRETASKIQSRIKTADYFLFLATPRSVASRWCPWEIGFADGVKALDRIFVVTTSDSAGSYGNEYLELYRHIDFADDGLLAAWMPGKMTEGTLVRTL